jgi:hypothetical protein
VPAVNLDMFDRRSAERFAQLLDETNGGRRHHARGQDDDQLAELVAIGRTLSAVRPAVQVDPEFRSGLRAMLVATAERDGIGETASTETAPGVHAAVREPSRRNLLGRSSAGRRIRARGAIVLGVAAGALAVSGISAASENAVPGDALYGVKRSTERAQLAMAGSDVTRGQLTLDFARNRLAEAAALDGDDLSFGTVLNDMDGDTRQGVRLLTGSALARKDAGPLAVVDRFVADQRQVLLPVVDHLNPVNRDRALVSLNLLDDIHQRSAALRATLDCTTGKSAGTDSLGPKPVDCVTGAGKPGTADQQGTSGNLERSGGASTGRTPTKAKPSETGSAPDPQSTDATGSDVRDPGAGDPAEPTTRPGNGVTQAPADRAPANSGGTGSGGDDAGDTDEDEGPLGGFLGDLLGGD